MTIAWEPRFRLPQFPVPIWKQFHEVYNSRRRKEITNQATFQIHEWKEYMVQKEISAVGSDAL